MLSQDEVGIIVTGCCLLLSELLPFTGMVQGNGVLHVLSLVFDRLGGARPPVGTTCTPPPSPVHKPSTS